MLPTEWHIPMVPDTFGYLKKACAKMDYRAKLLEADEGSKAAYEQKKITELLDSHLGRKN